MILLMQIEVRDKTRAGVSRLKDKLLFEQVVIYITCKLMMQIKCEVWTRIPDSTSCLLYDMLLPQQVGLAADTNLQSRSKLGASTSS